ncbi:amino acid ABC transporter permease [Mesorhizobium sp. AR02]|uniref:amino acid ABC transporter permease n=1 Tax=Mesorhizobium sp. AR02 TaxID=2865837 RepID=UPI00215F348A|nr:amino acid ABC transporter permease [Mesorhizobium sp. AR02]UVK54598.1 amino acid ABC transporter permease [Mesorhizobium sp. AR02]
MMETLTTWWGWVPQLAAGLWVSTQLLFWCLLFGLPAGLVLALTSSSALRAVRWTSIVLVEIGRGAPALVVLQMVYFGLPTVGLTFAPFLSGAIALSLTTAAYTSEILRAGLQSVPYGEVEAAMALGMRRRDTLRYVVIPQGIMVAIPALLGFAVLMFQVTSLAFTIAIPELLSRAYRIGASNFRYLDVLTASGMLYLTVILPFGWLVSHIEQRMSRHLTK